VQFSVYEADNIKSRPSVADNGRTVVFVNATGHIILIDLQYSQTGEVSINTTQLSTNPEWRNAAISKDGRFLAGLTETRDNNIYVYDLLNLTSPSSRTFTLYNPTYTQGQFTGDVAFADVMEFDYSGQYIMYDAFNELSNSTQNLSYWDIGFLKFLEDNGQFANGTQPFISKLFNGLPEKTNVGNPTFAKNSPYVIAFDIFNGIEEEHNILGANIETGESSVIAANIGDYGWPNYDRQDQSIIFHAPDFFSNLDLYRQGVNATKIQPQGNESQFISDHFWGVWYANGQRSLNVGTNSASGNVSKVALAPNPATDASRLSFELSEAQEVDIRVLDLNGRLVMNRKVSALSGVNYLDIRFDYQPNGTYWVQLRTAEGLATLKLTKI
jgi:bacillolysin